jgi:hypothetical protein
MQLLVCVNFKLGAIAIPYFILLNIAIIKRIVPLSRTWNETPNKQKKKGFEGFSHHKKFIMKHIFGINIVFLTTH